MSNDSATTKYLNELENISRKERFGLFTQPPGISIGDKFSESKGQHDPKNILTNPKLQSTVEPSLFQYPGFTSLNDPYKDNYKLKQIEDKQRIDNIPHSQAFKPSDSVKTQVGSEFKHMKEYDDKVYNTRDSSGNVLTGPRNFYTNPHQKGLGNTTVGHLFEPINYQGCPYDYKQQIDIGERAAHQSKILNLNRPFCSTSKGNRAFVEDRNTYGLTKPLVDGKRHNFNYPGIAHPQPFKNGDPAKQGYNKTLSKFPQYLEQGQQIQKVKPASTEKAWRPNSNGTFSRPTPVISQFVTNFQKMTSFQV